MKKVAEALEKIYEAREITRRRRHAEVRRPSSGVGSVEGELVLGWKSDSSVCLQGIEPNLVHEK